jgi:LPXTG-motif cell wall-anchored protein
MLICYVVPSSMAPWFALVGLVLMAVAVFSNRRQRER